MASALVPPREVAAELALPGPLLVGVAVDDEVDLVAFLVEAPGEGEEEVGVGDDEGFHAYLNSSIEAGSTGTDVLLSALR